MRRTHTSMRLALALLRLTAPIVPRGQRQDWRAEWVAELMAESDRPRPGRDGPAARCSAAPWAHPWMRCGCGSGPSRT